MEKMAVIPNERGEPGVSVKATLGGIIVTLSCMYFLMSFAAILGFWSFHFEEIPTLGVPFWSITSAAWIFSACLGALISVLISKTHSVMNGIIQALISWGGAYLIFGGLTVAVADSSMMDMVFPMSQVLMKIGFFGDALALFGALASSWFAVQIQRGIERKEKSRENMQSGEFQNSERSFHIPVHT